MEVGTSLSDVVASYVVLLMLSKTLPWQWHVYICMTC